MVLLKWFDWYYNLVVSWCQYLLLFHFSLWLILTHLKWVDLAYYLIFAVSDVSWSFVWKPNSVGVLKLQGVGPYLDLFRGVLTDFDLVAAWTTFWLLWSTLSDRVLMAEVIDFVHLILVFNALGHLFRQFTRWAQKVDLVVS